MGIEINRFQGDVDEELICVICSGVLDNPLHVYFISEQQGATLLLCLYFPFAKRGYLIFCAFSPFRHQTASMLFAQFAFTNGSVASPHALLIETI